MYILLQLHQTVLLCSKLSVIRVCKFDILNQSRNYMSTFMALLTFFFQLLEFCKFCTAACASILEMSAIVTCSLVKCFHKIDGNFMSIYFPALKAIPMRAPKNLNMSKCALLFELELSVHKSCPSPTLLRLLTVGIRSGKCGV